MKERNYTKAEVVERIEAVRKFNRWVSTLWGYQTELLITIMADSLSTEALNAIRKGGV